MYAVIETGGKQYRVQEGDVITVEKLDAAAGDAVKLDKVLILSDGDTVKVGTPYLEGAAVAASVVENGKGKKVIIFKYKSKKDYRKKQGHRQPYTMLKIESLDGKTKAKAPAAEAAEPVKKPSLKSMKKAELIAFAQENNIEIDEKATNAVMIETIEAALK